MTRNCLALGALLCSIACTVESQSPESDPNFFRATLKDEVISGSYNPTAYTAQSVQNQLKVLCAQEQLGAYSEHPIGSGLTGFTTACATVSPYTRVTLSVEKEADGSYAVDVTGF